MREWEVNKKEEKKGIFEERERRGLFVIWLKQSSVAKETFLVGS